MPRKAVATRSAVVCSKYISESEKGMLLRVGEDAGTVNQVVVNEVMADAERGDGEGGRSGQA